MAWDATKPPNGGLFVSADHRANWVAIAQAIGAVNLLADPTFLMWPAGDAAAPAHWTLTGAGVTIARAGTGLGDTTRKVGKFCPKVTSAAGVSGQLSQNLLSTTSYDDGFDNLIVAAGAWVKCSTASAAQLQITDGAGTSSSAFHTGGGAWEWLTVVRTIDPAATKLVAQLNVIAGTIAAYISGSTFLLGAVPPSYYQPAPIARGSLVYPVGGTLSVASPATQLRPELERPAIVVNTRLRVGTAPTGAALITSPQKNGASAIYTTLPQIAAGASSGNAAPDGTYANRCLAAGDYVTLNTTQVGSTVAGADLTAAIVCLQYLRPLEAFLAVGDNN